MFYSNSNSDTLISVIFPSDKSNSIRELFSSKDLQTSSTVVQSDASIVNVTSNVFCFMILFIFRYFDIAIIFCSKIGHSLLPNRCIP